MTKSPDSWTHTPGSLAARSEMLAHPRAEAEAPSGGQGWVGITAGPSLRESDLEGLGQMGLAPSWMASSMSTP